MLSEVRTNGKGREKNGGVPFEVQRSQRMMITTMWVENHRRALIDRLVFKLLKIRKAIFLLLWHVMVLLLGGESQQAPAMMHNLLQARVITYNLMQVICFVCLEIPFYSSSNNYFFFRS